MLKNRNFKKNSKKRKLWKCFGTILGVYTKKQSSEFMILAFHVYPLEPKITKCEDPLHNSSLAYGTRMNDSAVNRDINASTTTQYCMQSCRY